MVIVVMSIYTNFKILNRFIISRSINLNLEYNLDVFLSTFGDIWINASKKFFIDNGHLRCLMLVSHKRKFTENLVNKFRAFER